MSVKTDSEIKALKTLKQKKIGELNILMEEAKNSQRLVAKLYDEISGLSKKIETFNNKQIDGEIVISEHALIRYVERVMGFDLEKIKSDMISKETQELVRTMGGSGTIKSGKCKLKIKNMTVITVID